MAHTVKRLARSTTSKLNSYTGPAGELCMDTQTNELVLQNGTKGGVRFGKSVTYTVVTASHSGLMSPDMLTKLNSIASGANAYTLPAATATSLGGVKVPSNANLTLSGGALSLTSANVVSALGYTPGSGNGTTYTLPAATATSLGGVKVPSNANLTLSGGALSLTSANVVSALGYTPGSGNGTTYTLPAATATSLGGIKVPSNANLTLSGGALSLTSGNVTSALGFTPAENTVFGGATASSAGTKGIVPAPAKGKQEAFLRGDGTWGGAVTSSASGLMTPELLTKLNSGGGDTFELKMTLSPAENKEYTVTGCAIGKPLIFLHSPIPTNTTTVCQIQIISGALGGYATGDGAYRLGNANDGAMSLFTIPTATTVKFKVTNGNGDDTIYVYHPMATTSSGGIISNTGFYPDYSSKIDYEFGTQYTATGNGYLFVYPNGNTASRHVKITLGSVVLDLITGYDSNGALNAVGVFPIRVGTKFKVEILYETAEHPVDSTRYLFAVYV